MFVNKMYSIVGYRKGLMTGIDGAPLMYGLRFVTDSSLNLFKPKRPVTRTSDVNEVNTKGKTKMQFTGSSYSQQKLINLGVCLI